MSFSECHLRPSCLAPFYPILTVAATGFFASAAVGQAPDIAACQLAPEEAHSCVLAMACIGEEIAFFGQAVGWDSGTLSGILSTGAECQGTWSAEETSAAFSCADGIDGQLVFWPTEDATGTIEGAGATGTGRPIRLWSGPDLPAYFQATTGSPSMVCGGNEISFN